MLSPVTVTLNPAIDQTVVLRDFVLNRLNRAHGFHQSPGGKGVNVSRMLAGHGIQSVATGFLGQQNEQFHCESLHSVGVTDDFVRTAGSTRLCLKIIDETAGTTTELNLPGTAPSASDLQRLCHRLEQLSHPGRWIIFAGSLPPGVSLQWFTSLIETLKRRGSLIAVDTSGPALRAAIETGIDLVKPNLPELETWAGMALPSPLERITAARELHRSVPHVLVTLGHEGAIFIAPDGALAATAPPVIAVNSVGAGDALLAGYIASLLSHQALAERAKLATISAWSVVETITPEPIVDANTCQRMQQITVSEL